MVLGVIHLAECISSTDSRVWWTTFSLSVNVNDPQRTAHLRQAASCQAVQPSGLWPKYVISDLNLPERTLLPNPNLHPLLAILL